MDNHQPNSPLDTLRQLKEMLDNGAITPTEFEALKQRLVFDQPTANQPDALASESVPLAPQPAADEYLLLEPLSPQPASVTPIAPAWASAPPPGDAGYAQESSLSETRPADYPSAPTWQTANEFPATREEPPTRSSLGLLLAIGGVLVFLAVVAYLNYNGRPSERLSSTSLTAADSAATVIETGPQAAQLPTPTTAPETVRVAPANPAPVIQPRPAAFPRDSAAEALPGAFPDSAARP